MTNFIRKHPILTALVFTMLVFLVVDAVSIAFYPLAYGWVSEDILYYLSDIVPYFFGIALACYLLRRFGLLDRVGFRLRGLGKGLLVGWVLIALSAYSLIEYIRYLDPYTFVTPSVALFLVCILDVFLIGVTEELIFRGGVLNILLERWGRSTGGIYLSVILTSILFGAIHFTNWVYYPQLFWSTMSQMVYASFFGVLMAAIYLRSRNLWAVALHHAFFNSSLVLSIFSQEAAVLEFTDITPEAAVYGVVTAVPYLLLGLFLLRKVRPADIYLHNEEADS